MEQLLSEVFGNVFNYAVQRQTLVDADLAGDELVFNGHDIVFNAIVGSGEFPTVLPAVFIIAVHLHQRRGDSDSPRRFKALIAFGSLGFGQDILAFS